MIIEQNHSIIPACDVDPERYEALLKATAALPGVGGYKIGFVLSLTLGLPRAVEIARRSTTKPLIYDHQKGATDIPDTGKAFARVCRRAKIDAVIFFPQSGPETARAWIEAAQEEGLGVIVGGLMTHKAYTRGEGGWIADESVMEMYLTAIRNGVTDFVVPGTSPAAIQAIRATLVREGIDPTFYAPGLGAQGGKIAEAAHAAGKRFHAIVGRALYDAADMQKAAEAQCKELFS